MSQVMDSLESRVDEAIHHNPHLAHQQLHIENHAGRIVLEGHVSSYYQKQIAQEVVRSITGVRAVENRLQVHGVSVH